jgi:hypothetical protein
MDMYTTFSPRTQPSIDRNRERLEPPRADTGKAPFARTHRRCEFASSFQVAAHSFRFFGGKNVLARHYWQAAITTRTHQTKNGDENA